MYSDRLSKNVEASLRKAAELFPIDGTTTVDKLQVRIQDAIFQLKEAELNLKEMQANGNNIIKLEVAVPSAS